MNIASLRPDSTTQEQTPRDIAMRLTRNKMHISFTQETHIVRDIDYLVGNYRSITSSSAQREQTWGTARRIINYDTWIHGSMQQYITQIARQSSRALRVTLDRTNSNMHIQILTTYAPHNGHTEDRKQSWEAAQAIMNKICKRQMII